MKWRHILFLLAFVVVYAPAAHADQWLCCDDRASRCNAECNDRDPYLSGNYCYFGSSHSSSCGCYYGEREYCPEPGAIKDSVCYYGSKRCTDSGCALSTCRLGRYDRCDRNDGCIEKENCNDKDGEHGGRYCRNNDVYVEYRDYYWDGTSCSYHTQDRRVEDCRYSCEYGSCTGREYCDDRDGEYGSLFCKYDDVYVKYRDYYQDGSGCSYRESDRKVEDCNDGCESGRCVDRERCDNRDGEYGERHCKYGNIYVEYRNYYYVDSVRCLYTNYDKKIEDCPNGCTGSECMRTNQCRNPDGVRGDKTCSGKKILECWDGYWVYEKYAECCSDAGCPGGSCVNNQCTGSSVPSALKAECANYCLDNKWLHDGAFKKGKCEYSITDCSSMNSCIVSGGKKICSSFSCMDGCIKTGETVEYIKVQTNRTLQFSVDVGIDSSKSSVPVNGTLYNGAIFGHNKIDVPVNGFVSTIELEIIDANEHGSLEIWVDGVSAYSSVLAKGDYVVMINRTAKRLEVFAGSSGWRFWSPAIYSIEGRAHVTASVPKTQSFEFELSSEDIGKMDHASLSVPNMITAMINGRESEGIVSSYIAYGTNSVVFEPRAERAAGISSLVLFFKQ